MLTMLKELYDDLNRYKRDKEVYFVMIGEFNNLSIIDTRRFQRCDELLIKSWRYHRSLSKLKNPSRSGLALYKRKHRIYKD